MMSVNNTMSKIGPNTWKVAFAFAFLALLVDGADLMLLSYSLTSIRTEFGLTSVEAGMLGSFTLAGMAIGGIFGGWACDKFGRVRIVVVSILLFSVLTCGLGFTNSFWEFGILRFLASLGLGSLYIASNTLMAEYVPTKHRTTVLGTLQAGWTVGYIVATLLAGWLIPDHGWRALFYVAAIPILLAIGMHFLVPEPAAWQQNRFKKVEITPIKGKFSLVIKDGSSTQLLRTSLDFGPATAAPAHCSDTLVTFTFKSVHLVCNNSSNHAITFAAAAVEVVIKYSFSDKRQDVPSSITIPSSLNIMPYLALPT